jgi:hypothetical protein
LLLGTQQHAHAEAAGDAQAYADPLLDGSTPLGAVHADVFSAIPLIQTPSA